MPDRGREPSRLLSPLAGARAARRRDGSAGPSAAGRAGASGAITDIVASPWELRQQGWAVNHNRVARIMREDHLLLCVPRRRFLLTTDSKHKLEVYVNLAARLELSGIDQLWVADLIYIRLPEQFVYLAVILDAFSRRVVGWALWAKSSGRNAHETKLLPHSSVR